MPLHHIVYPKVVSRRNDRALVHSIRDLPQEEITARRFSLQRKRIVGWGVLLVVSNESLAHQRASDTPDPREASRATIPVKLYCYNLYRKLLGQPRTMRKSHNGLRRRRVRSLRPTTRKGHHKSKWNRKKSSSAVGRATRLALRETLKLARQRRKKEAASKMTGRTVNKTATISVIVAEPRRRIGGRR
jgi:hypothetical protein